LFRPGTWGKSIHGAREKVLLCNREHTKHRSLTILKKHRQLLRKYKNNTSELRHTETIFEWALVSSMARTSLVTLCSVTQDAY